MRPSPPLPPKKEVALALLAHSSVFIHLDPRVANVVVPPWFKKQPQLVLQVGLNMPVPIHDLHLDDDGMSCTLSFNRAPFHCMVPWTAVYAMVDDEGRAMVWPDDVPPEVQQQVRVRAVDPPAPSAPAAVAVPAKKDATKRPKLEEVRTEPSAGAPPKKGKGKAGKAGASPETGARLSAVPSRSRGGADGAAARPPEKLTPVASPRPQPVAAPARSSEEREPPSSGAPGTGSSQKPRPARPVAGAARKPKRELPPYLRVVK